MERHVFIIGSKGLPRVFRARDDGPLESKRDFFFIFSILEEAISEYVKCIYQQENLAIRF